MVENPKFHPKGVVTEGRDVNVENEDEMLPEGAVQEDKGSSEGNIPDTAPDRQAPEAARGLDKHRPE